MRIQIFILFTVLLSACQQHSRALERNSLRNLNSDLLKLESLCIEVLTDIDETSLEDLDSIFLITGDTIWVSLKKGYSESESRMIDLSRLIDREEDQLTQLEKGLNRRQFDREEFQSYFAKEKLNVSNLEKEINSEMNFRKELKALKIKLRKKYQL